MDLLQETYATVAVAAGLDTADRYLAVFKSRPDLCFLTKAIYCEISGLHDQLLLEDTSMIGRLDLSCRQYVIQSMIATGRHEEALREIEAFLDENYMMPELLHMLLVIAEKAPGDAGAKARHLHKGHVAMHDAVVDLDDVVKTGIVFDDGGKKQIQFFRKMTRDQFDKYLAEETERPVTRKLLELYRKAADVYKENGLPAEAARCLWRIIAHGHAEKEIFEDLAEIFANLNNTALPNYIRTL